jgi:hypothetical protein
VPRQPHARLCRLPAKESHGTASRESPTAQSYGALHRRVAFRTHPVQDESVEQPCFCWAHARRPFYEFYTSTQSPLAAEVLASIAKLYAIEADIRGQPPDVRQSVRQVYILRHWDDPANSLIQTRKLNSINPLAWLTDVLQRIVSGQTKNHQLHTLLPWNWRQPSTIVAT